MATVRSYSATVGMLDPEARWRFDEESGDSALDRAGTLSGSYQGGFAHGAPGPIGDGAVGFDGSDALTRVGTTSSGEPIRLGFLGDSLVEGFRLAAGEAFPAVLTAALEGQGFAIEPVVRGFGGLRSDELLSNARGNGIPARPADELAGQDLDAVILVIGTNDSLQGRDPAGVKDNLREIIETFQDAGTEVLLTSTFWLWPTEILDSRGYDTTDPANADVLAAEFEAIFPDLAGELGVSLFGPFTEPVRDNPGSFNLVVGDDVAPGNVIGPEPDGVHPNAAGVEQIVQNILPDAVDLIDAVDTGGENLLALDDGSIEGWFVADDTDGVQGLIARDADGRNDGDFRIFLDGGRLRAVVETGGGSTMLRSDANAVEAGRAFHVVLAFGAAGVALFLNGELVDSDAGVFSASGNDNPLLFGALAGSGGAESFFDGVIDEVVVYGDVLDAGDVSDLFRAGRDGNTLVGTNQGDTIISGEDDESLRGRGGADELRGNGGDDELIGGSGRDSGRGGPGNDTARGGGGRDSLKGDDGDDLLLGNAGGDLISGGAGDDAIQGGGGADRIFGNAGDDTLEGGPGADVISGGGGLDRIFGGGGGDDLSGGAGNDLTQGNGGGDDLRGGGGDDQLFGDNGTDELFGGAGNDLLVGGSGKDLLTGGAGADVFRIESLGDRLDKIFDFAGVVEGFTGGADPAAFVRLVDNGIRTRVQVDADGGGDGFTSVADLVGVGGADLDQLVVDGNLNLG